MRYRFLLIAASLLMTYGCASQPSIQLSTPRPVTLPPPTACLVRCDPLPVKSDADGNFAEFLARDRRAVRDCFLLHSECVGRMTDWYRDAR